MDDKDFRLDDYQNLQQKILTNNGQFHESHEMFVDLTDMWRGCLKCGVGTGSVNEIDRLGKPCPK